MFAYYRFYQLILLFFMLACVNAAYAQNCGCTDCPINLPEGASIESNLIIQGATNPTLGVNGQGVCGVKIEFEHQFLADLLVTLTNPAGQTVTLMGNNGFFGDTDFTQWDVTFVPCGITPMPDIGFLPQWDNNQAWGVFGLYDGTYHPYTDCLEDFTGAANGTWTLSVDDVLPGDTGIIVSWSLIFCDSTGIACINCVADAGNLTQPDITACQGDSALMPNLVPTYTLGSNPPSATYGYQYLVLNQNSVIEQITPTLNLMGYPVGNYSVCGLSYLSAEQSQIPIPNGMMTLNQLNVALQSAAPPFCGDLTNNCVNLTVTAPLPDTILNQTICSGASVTFFGNTYGTPGTYSDTIRQGNCSYKAILNLTINPLVRDTIDEFVCQGSCSNTTGFNTACVTGTYLDTLTNTLGCDSLIRQLNLIVSTIEVFDFLPQNPIIACNNPASVNGFTIGGQPTGFNLYDWYFGGSSTPYQTGSQLNTTLPGAYLFQVCEQIPGNSLQCCDTATVVVTAAQGIPPTPTVINVPNQVCVGDTVTVTSPVIPGADTYAWQYPPSAVLIPTGIDTQIRLILSQVGNTQICLSVANTCGNSGTFCANLMVNTGVTQPILVGDNLPCPNTPFTYYYTNLQAGAAAFWTVQNDISTITYPTQDSITVTWPPGNTASEVCISVISACNDTLTSCLTISASSVAPTLTSVNSNLDTICFGGSVSLNIPVAAGINYGWSFPASLVEISGSGTNQILLLGDMLGTFPVCAWYDNNCQSSDTICKSITVLNNQPPDAGPDLSSCTTQVQLQGTGTTGVWSIASEPVAGSGTFTDQFVANTQFQGSPGIYRLVRTNGGGGCTRTDTMTLTLRQPLEFTQSQAVCLPGDSTYVIEASWMGGTAPYQLTGAMSTMLTMGTATLYASGSNGRAILQDANGCSDTLFAFINCACTNQPGSFLAASQAECQDTPMVLAYNNDANPAAGQVVRFVVGTTSLWNQNTIIVQSTPSIPFNPAILNPGDTYYVWAVVIDTLANGLPDYSDPCLQIGNPIEITWVSTPTITITGDTTNCFGILDSVSLTFTVNSAFFPVNANVYNGLGLATSLQFFTQNPITLNNLPDVNGWYWLADIGIADHPNCIVVQDSIFIDPITVQQPIVRDSFVICNNQNNSIDLQTFIFTGIVGGFWTGPNIGTGTLPNININGTPPGIYPFVYHAPPNLPCPLATDTTWLVVIDCACPPFILDLLAGPLCNQGSSTYPLNTLVNNAGPGVWSVAGLLTPAPIITMSNLDALNAATGSYELIYTLTTPTAGCPTADTIPLFVASGGLSAGVGLGTPSFCFGVDSILTLFDLLSQADTGGTWEYSGPPNGIFTVGAQIGPFLLSQVPIGAYTFNYIQTSVPPCSSDTASVTISIISAPSANAGPDQLIDCTLPTATLDGGNSVGSISNQGFLWTAHQTAMTVGMGEQVEVFAEGVYILTVIDSITQCSDTDTVQVLTDNSLPNGFISVQPATCVPNSGAFQIDSIIGGIAPYQIVVNGVDQGDQTRFFGLAAGAYLVEINDANGCSWLSQPVLIDQSGGIQLALGADTTIQLGDTIDIQAQLFAANGYDTLIWSVIGLDTMPFSLNQRFAPLAPLRISLTVIDSLGCRATDDILVNLVNLPSVIVPNVMMPGSNKNGLISVLGGQDVAQIDLWQIYDRWGNLVFEDKNFAPSEYANAWDGRYKNKPVNPGVYVYALKFTLKDGRSIWQHGDITVLR
jgi:subtilisin-like proprotein convertase family protein